jgi:hypothetical protein
MSVNVYNVIWADDECDTLKKDAAIRKLFDDKRIEVLKYVATSEALKDAIECYKDKIDAVIVDGNFSKGEVEYVESDDISGLIHTISFIELFNVKRDIPFFLYTARKILLQEICKNGEIDYFIKTERLIQKGNIDKLADKIIKDVDHIHSVEFMVKKRYQSLINIAKNVDKQCAENFHQFLLDEARDKNFDKSVDMFNQLRGIMEQIMERCREYNIVPEDVRTLNNFKTFFNYTSRKDKDKDKRVYFWLGYGGYKPTDVAMPKAIGYSINSLIDIIQDGSHKIQNLNLGVSEYVQESQSPFLFRSCLYQVMDIIRWYNDTRKALMDGKLKGPLYSIKTEKY